jgi:hypothetical protein
VLKPQDILVCLDVALHDDHRSYAAIAAHLHISVGTAHAAVRRSMDAQLLDGAGEPILPNLIEFLVHGVRYAFFAKLGSVVRGVPTGTAAPFVQDWLTLQPERALVWPDPRGRARGQSVEPLFPTVPQAAAACGKLHLSLALVDLLRVGSARERTVAAEALEQQLRQS